MSDSVRHEINSGWPRVSQTNTKISLSISRGNGESLPTADKPPPASLGRPSPRAHHQLTNEHTTPARLRHSLDGALREHTTSSSLAYDAVAVPSWTGFLADQSSRDSADGLGKQEQREASWRRS